MKRFLFLLLGLTIAVGASADVDSWLEQHHAMSQAKAERVTHKQHDKHFRDRKAHDLSLSSPVQNKSANNLRDGDPVAITEQPEGTLVTYKRSGWYQDYMSETVQPQMGYVYMVYDPDGTTVYIKDLVFYAHYNTWVRGTIGGGKLTVPMGQYVRTYYNNNGQYESGAYLTWSFVGQAYFEEDDYYYLDSFSDSTVAEVTYTIDGDNFILDNSVGTADGIGARGLGVVWDDNGWCWGTEWNTTFTRAELPTIINVQPEGDRVNFKRRINSADYVYNSTMSGEVPFNVVFAPDGQTAYVLDPANQGSGSWVVGTFNNNKITVPLGQYLRYDSYAKILTVWGTNIKGDKSNSFILDPSVTEVTFTIGNDGYVTMDNSSSGFLGDRATGLAAINDDGQQPIVLIWDQPEYVTPNYDQPDGTLVTYTRSGSAFDNRGNIYSQGGTVDVIYAPDGQTVYIKDIIYGSSYNSWVKGTIEGGKIHVPMGQLVYWFEELRSSYGFMLTWAQTYYDEDSGGYRCYYDPTVTEATFTINGDVITMDNSSFGPNNDAIGATGLCIVPTDDTGYFFQCEVMTQFSDPIAEPTVIVEQPEGELVTLARTGYSVDDQGTVSSQFGTVNIVIAPDGNTVYIQDIIYHGPGTWVRGTIQGDKVHVPLGQYIFVGGNLPELTKFSGNRGIEGNRAGVPIKLAAGQIVPDPEYDGYYILDMDPSMTEITFTMSDDGLSLDNTGFGPNGEVNGAMVIAAIPLNDHPEYYYQCDLLTAFGMPTIIWEQPEGTLITCLRSGYYVDDVGNVNEQSGTVNLVLAPDGNTVYIQDIVYRGSGSWVMGTIEGNKIHVPLEQYLASFYEGSPTKFKASRGNNGNRGNMYIRLAAGEIVPDPEYDGYYILDMDPSMTEITFTLDDDVISLDNTGFGPNGDANGAMAIAAIPMNDYPEYYYQCDLLTVFSPLPETPTVIVEQPEGELVTYQRTGDGMWSIWKKGAKDSEGSRYVNANTINDQRSQVNVVYAPDGETVYIQDIVFCSPQNNRNTWVQGTLSADGTQIIVPLDQFVSWDEYEYRGERLAWGSTAMEAPVSNSEDDEQRVIFTPDPDVTHVTFTIQGNCISMDNSLGSDSEDYWEVYNQFNNNEIDWDTYLQAMSNLYQSTGLAYVDIAGNWTGEINWGTAFTSKHPTTLPDPVIIAWHPAEANWDDSYLEVKVPEFDTEGLPIFEDALSYSIYIDNGQLFNFEAGKYNIEEDMTEITYDTWENQDWSLYIGYPAFKDTWSDDGFVPFFNWRIGIQFHYTVDGVKNSTGITYIEVYEKPEENTGDVNGDGKTSITDVTALINCMLSGEGTIGNSDVNGDGKVSIADVTALITILLESNN